MKKRLDKPGGGGKCIYITINFAKGGGIVYGGENYQRKGNGYEQPAEC